MSNLALLVLRVVTGSLLAGHGAQKLFGSFEGPGIEGTGQMMESMGLEPGKQWAALAGASEFGGGALTALGLLNPLGPLGVIGAMLMAWEKAHKGNPIWAMEGGAELPLTNIAVVTAIMLSGPGRYSLDRALGIELPRWLGPLGFLAALYVVLSTRSGEDQEGESQ